MAMKKKKSEKGAAPRVVKNRSPARELTGKATGQVPASSRPVLTGISRSLGSLLGRTKAYFGSGKKAEA